MSLVDQLLETLLCTCHESPGANILNVIWLLSRVDIQKKKKRRNRSTGQFLTPTSKPQQTERTRLVLPRLRKPMRSATTAKGGYLLQQLHTISPLLWVSQQQCNEDSLCFWGHIWAKTANRSEQNSVISAVFPLQYNHWLQINQSRFSLLITLQLIKQDKRGRRLNQVK